jgi:uncharacterized protein (TIGR03435 family)
MRFMLQSLLAERFKLALHRESKEATVYQLVLSKGGPQSNSLRVLFVALWCLR